MDLLERLLGHDSWTTRRLLDLAGTLNDRQFDQEFDIGHRTVRRTFEHIIWNIECWTDLMRENGVRPRPESNQSIAALTHRLDAATSELHQFAREIVDQDRLDESFLDSLDDPPRRKSFGAAILHIATHGMHHRAQLLFMLRRLGVEHLPEGDALSWEQSASTRNCAQAENSTVCDIGSTVIESAIISFRANKGWADQAVAQLSDDKIHVALDTNTNSIAVIMKHVAGNLLSRWTGFLTTDGEKPWRNRDDEFVDSFKSRADVLDYWELGWDCLFTTLQSLEAGDLSQTVTIRGEPHSVPLAIHRSLAHCGYHVGQIIMIARILAGDEWETITIPRGGSSAFNDKVWNQGHFQTSADRVIDDD